MLRRLLDREPMVVVATAIPVFAASVVYVFAPGNDKAKLDAKLNRKAEILDSLRHEAKLRKATPFECADKSLVERRAALDSEFESLVADTAAFCETNRPPASRADVEQVDSEDRAYSTLSRTFGYGVRGRGETQAELNWDKSTATASLADRTTGWWRLQRNE